MVPGWPERQLRRFWLRQNDGRGVSSAVGMLSELWEVVVFDVGLFEDGEVGVGAVPEGE
jgi:hypothetical protein